MSLIHFHLQNQCIASHLDAGNASKGDKDRSFTLMLSEDDLHHAQVLRIKPGEHIAVIDASQDYFECEVVALTAREMRVVVAAKLNAPNLPHISLVQGLPKSDKMETIIRHATEIGIECIIPWQAKRSIAKLQAQKKEQKYKRWQEIARSASAQSGRIDIPVVSGSLTSKDLPEELADYDCVFVCYEEARLDASLSEAVEKALNAAHKDIESIRIALVIGPEGGIDSQEIELVQGLDNVSLVSLGSTILRTETAALVASALVVNEYNRARRVSSVR